MTSRPVRSHVTRTLAPGEKETLLAGIAKRRAEVEREFMLAVLGKDGEP